MPSPSPTRSVLPEEIGKAIEALIFAVYSHGLGVGDGTLDQMEPRRSAEARATLTASILARLNAVEAARRLPDSVTIQFARRPDGGLRVVCDELPGLVLSHEDHALVLTDLVPAIETLVFDKLAAALARVERMEKALEKLEAHRERLFEPWNAKNAIWPEHPKQYRYGDGGTFTISFTNKEAREILEALASPVLVEERDHGA